MSVVIAVNERGWFLEFLKLELVRYHFNNGMNKTNDAAPEQRLFHRQRKFSKFHTTRLFFNHGANDVRILEF